MNKITTLLMLLLITSCSANAKNWVSQYNVVWTEQSENSGGSMPLSGKNMGCNVWVEGDELLFYFASPGCRDEWGALLKYGRMRVATEPNIFKDASFKQELNLEDGAIYITTESKTLGKSQIKMWAEVDNPVVHFDYSGDSEVELFATYESWREKPILLPEHYSFNHAKKKIFRPHYERSISYGNTIGIDEDVFIYNDNFKQEPSSVQFYHRMREEDNFFHKQVEQQELTSVKDKLFNPLTNLTFGGELLSDSNLSFVKETRGRYAQDDFIGFQYKSDKTKDFSFKLVTHINQTATVEEWETELDSVANNSKDEKALWASNKAWWKNYWDCSHIIINEDKGAEDEGWQVGRNYNLFRYMLASGHDAVEPLMFNGGVFTFDPCYEGKEIYEAAKNSVYLFDYAGYDDSVQQTPGYTPDFRRWGTVLTAQNQRLVYFPMLRSGDYDMAEVFLDWYLSIMPTTQTAVREYYGIDGNMTPEQVTSTGLIGMSEYGWTDDSFKNTNKYRRAETEKGITDNGISRIFTSQLEVSWYMLEFAKYSGRDITKYLEFIEQAVIFYDEYYRMWEKRTTGKELLNGKLHIYPANALENHPYAENPNCAIFGLEAVLNGLLELPDDVQSKEKKERWAEMLSLLPEHPLGEKDGKKYYKVAANKEISAHKSECAPELYGLFPYKRAGLGDDLTLFKNAIDVVCSVNPAYNKVSEGWNQNCIQYAMIGDAQTAKLLVSDKIGNGYFRFPAYFPADYTPDHNAGGSGAIALQEMLIQSRNNEIRILPAWPEEWDVDYKLAAPYETVECKFKEGKVKKLKVTKNNPATKVIEYQK